MWFPTNKPTRLLIGNKKQDTTPAKTGTPAKNREDLVKQVRDHLV